MIVVALAHFRFPLGVQRCCPVVDLRHRWNLAQVIPWIVRVRNAVRARKHDGATCIMISRTTTSVRNRIGLSGVPAKVNRQRTLSRGAFTVRACLRCIVDVGFGPHVRSLNGPFGSVMRLPIDECTAAAIVGSRR